MTSRSSFFKLLKEDLRQRLWTIILAAVVFILPVPIYLAMQISNPHEYAGSVIRRLASPLEVESVWLVLVTIVGATICAVSGFGYLFSKKKVDFFHSLPVKREVLFAVRYVNGVLIYLVPYVVMLLVSFVIITIGGYMSSATFVTAMEGLAVHLLNYLTIYTTLILCVTFVGNIVVFFAVSGWTFGITAVAVLIYNWFEDTFFDTYYYYSYTVDERLHSLRFLCPAYFYVAAIDEVTLSLFLQQLVFTIVLIVITLLVYRVRPSDGAGKAIAFPVLKPVIRISIEVLAGALMGMLFYTMAGESGIFWMVFGVVLGVVLSHMLIQSIFHFDVRKCFADKLSMAICGVATVVFTLVMYYDAFGYDTYLPKEKQIESVAVDMGMLDAYREARVYADGVLNWVDDIEFMRLTDTETVYPYLEALVEDSEFYFEEVKENRYPGGYLSIGVAMRLENGKTVYRRYVSNGLREDVFAPIFESEEYKQAHYADIYTAPEQYVHSVTVANGMNQQTMSLGETERAEFLSVLRRELSAQKLSEKVETLPVAMISLRILEDRIYYDANGNRRERHYDYSSQLPIYASYTETLRFLAERGFDPDAEYVWTGEEKMRIVIPHYVLKAQEGSTVTGDVEFGEYDTYYVEETVSYPMNDGYDGDYYLRTGAYEEEVEYFLINGKKIPAAIEYPEGWGYGINTVPVDPEDFEELFELCVWEDLTEYGDPSVGNSDDYRVSLEIPMDGYNNYDIFRFIVPADADVSFLFD